MQDNTIEKGDVGDSGDPEIRMPWKELLEAFIADTPRRMKRIADCSYEDRQLELRELRTLSLQAPRQCGKTEACFDIIRNYPGVKFAVNDLCLTHYKLCLGDRFKDRVLLREFGLRPDRYASYPFNKRTFAGVKLLIMDRVSDGNYRCLENAFMFEKNWFDPDFSIIRVL